MLKTSITLSALAFMISGCAGAQQVQVKGDTPDLLQLAGEWEGDYKGIDSGRTGKISFDLAVGRHTATGSVLMMPAGAKHSPRALKIQFVRVRGGQVSGTVGPYTDPQCNCEVQTEFIGDIDGDVIDGTFVTKIASLDKKQVGMWSVTRK